MRRKRITFLRSYIDFCFMLIIILISLLSIAYFEPPGSSGTEGIKPIIPGKGVKELKPKEKKEDLTKIKEALATKEKELVSLKKRIKLIEEYKMKIKEQEKILRELKKELKEKEGKILLLRRQIELETLGLGKHEFIDLRGKEKK